MEQITLYKERSYAACISEGYKFLAQHLRMIVKILLPYFILSSLLLGIHNGITQYHMTQFFLTGEMSFTAMTLVFVTFTLAYCMTVFSIARMYLMFRRVFGIESSSKEEGTAPTRLSLWKATCRRTSQLSLRTLPYSIWPYLFSVVLFFVVVYGYRWVLSMFLSGNMQTAGPTTTPEQTNWIAIAVVCVMSVLFIAFVILMLPLNYTFDHRMMLSGDANALGNRFRTQYRIGIKHLGKIFGVNTICGFILILASAVFALPDYVLSQAYKDSITSQITFGDTAHIPTSAYAVMIVISAIASAFTFILSVAFHVAHVLLYGDIVTKENS